MALRRMIHKKISLSEQVNSLSDPAQLLFTWMIAHADDFGRMPGSPTWVKGAVVPLKPWGLADVAGYLQEMVKAGVIYWYEVDGKKYIQLCSWDRYQTGLHKRTKSEFPEFPGSSGNPQEVPGLARAQNRTEQNRTEQNRTEQNYSAEAGASALSLPNPQKPGDEEWLAFCQTLDLPPQEARKLIGYFRQLAKVEGDQALAEGFVDFLDAFTANRIKDLGHAKSYVKDAARRSASVARARSPDPGPVYQDLSLLARELEKGVDSS